MRKIRYQCLLLQATAIVILSFLSSSVQAQTFALKNNLLYDATLTPNLGAEVKLAKHSTVQVFYGLNPWERSDRKSLRHWSVMPEYRYWTRQAFRGTFVGVHAVGGEYNVGGGNSSVWPVQADPRQPV